MSDDDPNDEFGAAFAVVDSATPSNAHPTAPAVTAPAAAATTGSASITAGGSAGAGTSVGGGGGAHGLSDADVSTIADHFDDPTDDPTGDDNVHTAAAAADAAAAALDGMWGEIEPSKQEPIRTPPAIATPRGPADTNVNANVDPYESDGALSSSSPPAAVASPPAPASRGELIPDATALPAASAFAAAAAVASAAGTSEPGAIAHDNWDDGEDDVADDPNDRSDIDVATTTPSQPARTITDAELAAAAAATDDEFGDAFRSTPPPAALTATAAAADSATASSPPPPVALTVKPNPFDDPARENFPDLAAAFGSASTAAAAVAASSAAVNITPRKQPPASDAIAAAAPPITPGGGGWMLAHDTSIDTIAHLNPAVFSPAPPTPAPAHANATASSVSPVRSVTVSESSKERELDEYFLHRQSSPRSQQTADSAAGGAVKAPLVLYDPVSDTFPEHPLPIHMRPNALPPPSPLPDSERSFGTAGADAGANASVNATPIRSGANRSLDFGAAGAGTATGSPQSSVNQSTIATANPNPPLPESPIAAAATAVARTPQQPSGRTVPLPLPSPFASPPQATATVQAPARGDFLSPHTNATRLPNPSPHFHGGGDLSPIGSGAVSPVHATPASASTSTGVRARSYGTKPETEDDRVSTTLDFDAAATTAPPPPAPAIPSTPQLPVRARPETPQSVWARAVASPPHQNDSPNGSGGDAGANGPPQFGLSPIPNRSSPAQAEPPRRATAAAAATTPQAKLSNSQSVSASPLVIAVVPPTPPPATVPAPAVVATPPASASIVARSPQQPQQPLPVPVPASDIKSSPARSASEWSAPPRVYASEYETVAPPAPVLPVAAPLSFQSRWPCRCQYLESGADHAPAFAPQPAATGKRFAINLDLSASAASAGGHTNTPVQPNGNGPNATPAPSSIGSSRASTVTLSVSSGGCQCPCHWQYEWKTSNTSQSRMALIARSSLPPQPVVSSAAAGSGGGGGLITATYINAESSTGGSGTGLLRESSVAAIILTAPIPIPPHVRRPASAASNYTPLRGANDRNTPQQPAPSGGDSRDANLTAITSGGNGSSDTLSSPLAPASAHLSTVSAVSYASAVTNKSSLPLTSFYRTVGTGTATADARNFSTAMNNTSHHSASAVHNLSAFASPLSSPLRTLSLSQNTTQYPPSGSGVGASAYSRSYASPYVNTSASGSGMNHTQLRSPVPVLAFDVSNSSPEKLRDRACVCSACAMVWHVDNPSHTFADWQIGMMSAYLTFSVLSILANGYLLWLVARDSKLRAQRSISLLVNLTVADFGTGVFIGIIHILNIAAGEWAVGQAGCAFQGSAAVLFCSASVSGLAIIGYERYRLIVKRNPLSERTTNGLIAIGWIWSALFAALPLFGLGRFAFQSSETLCAIEWWSHEPSGLALTIGVIAVGLNAPLNVGVSSYVSIFKFLKQNTYVAPATLRKTSTGAFASPRGSIDAGQVTPGGTGGLLTPNGLKTPPLQQARTGTPPGVGNGNGVGNGVLSPASAVGTAAGLGSGKAKFSFAADSAVPAAAAPSVTVAVHAVASPEAPQPHPHAGMKKEYKPSSRAASVVKPPEVVRAPSHDTNQPPESKATQPATGGGGTPELVPLSAAGAGVPPPPVISLVQVAALTSARGGGAGAARVRTIHGSAASMDLKLNLSLPGAMPHSGGGGESGGSTMRGLEGGLLSPAAAAFSPGPATVTPGGGTGLNPLTAQAKLLEHRRKQKMAREQSIAVRMLALGAVFALFWAPYTAKLFYELISGVQVPGWYDALATVAVGINSCVNPMAILYVNDRLRELVREQLCVCSVRKSTVQVGDDNDDDPTALRANRAAAAPGAGGGGGAGAMGRATTFRSQGAGGANTAVVVRPAVPPAVGAVATAAAARTTSWDGMGSARASRAAAAEAQHKRLAGGGGSTVTANGAVVAPAAAGSDEKAAAAPAYVTTLNPPDSSASSAAGATAGGTATANGATPPLQH